MPFDCVIKDESCFYTNRYIINSFVRTSYDVFTVRRPRTFSSGLTNNVFAVNLFTLIGCHQNLIGFITLFMIMIYHMRWWRLILSISDTTVETTNTKQYHF